MVVMKRMHMLAISDHGSRRVAVKRVGFVSLQKNVLIKLNVLVHLRILDYREKVFFVI